MISIESIKPSDPVVLEYIESAPGISLALGILPFAPTFTYIILTWKKFMDYAGKKVSS